MSLVVDLLNRKGASLTKVTSIFFYHVENVLPNVVGTVCESYYTLYMPEAIHGKENVNTHHRLM